MTTMQESMTFPVTGTDGKQYIVTLRGYGKWATEQNGCLDGKKYKLSTNTDLASWMNQLAHDWATGMKHWVTEGVIHFLRVDPTGNLVEWGIL
jgi:hypothetical protein